MLLQRTLCVIVLYVLVLFSDKVVSGADCVTPKKEPGYCLPIESCPPLEKLASENRNSETLLYLKDSICGYPGMIPNLCCPVGQETTEPPPLDLKPSPTPTPKPAHKPPVTPSTLTLPTQGGNSGSFLDVSLSSRLSMLPLEECGDAGEVRIIGGTKANVYQFPWMALLGYSSSSNGIDFRCGGTIISNRYVLTAAHCVTGEGSQSAPKPVVIRLGELDINNQTDCTTNANKQTVCAPPVEDYAIDEIISHANFSKHTRFADDIALIRLNQTITYKDHIKPICLPIGPEQLAPLPEDVNKGKKMIVAGWGVTELGAQSHHLLSTFVPLAKHETCATTYSTLTNIDISESRQLCAGGKGKTDSCAGDSGGPLKFYGEVKGDQKIVQFGIVSFGPRVCATEKLYGVYTRVGYYMDWVLNNMRP